jgi:hypothetical protein
MLSVVDQQFLRRSARTPDGRAGRTHGDDYDQRPAQETNSHGERPFPVELKVY